jgi:hypothetical protein
VRPTVILLAAGLALTACGEAPRPAAEPDVQLKLEVPDDGRSVRDDHVAVRGTVVPADAAVEVAGADADVQGGEFNAEVKLQPGGNVIDVTATSPGRRPATDALRVQRDMRVEIPVLTGKSLDDADDALRTLGLRTVEQRGGGWLDNLLPGPVNVCATTPAAHTLVQPNSSVTLETAHDC